MRTSLRIRDDLLRALKVRAAEENRSMTSILEEAMQCFLMRAPKKRKKESIVLPTFKGKGLHQGVDLDDSAALISIMEEER